MGTAYKWHVQMIFLENGSNPINIDAKNIDSGVIDYNYNSEARMPIVMVNVNLDKNLIDKMVKTKDKSRIQFVVNNVNTTNGSNIHEPYINHICTYEMNDDVYDEKTINYGRDTGATNRKDVYANTVIGLISEQIVENNVKANDCVLKDGNMTGAVTYFLRHMPLVIEPFSFNKEYEQLIVPPQESTNEILKFLNDIGTFYDTPYRYFMDFNYTYLLSNNGVGVPVQGEKYNDVIISIRNADKDADALELGISEENNAYVLKVLEDDSNIFVNNTQDKDFTKLVGILDPSRKDSLPSIINDVITTCKASANEILSSVRAAIPSLMDGINNVIVGKNEVDFSCNCTQKDASGFKQACDSVVKAIEPIIVSISTPPGMIVIPTNSSSTDPASTGQSSTGSSSSLRPDPNKLHVITEPADSELGPYVIALNGTMQIKLYINPKDGSYGYEPWEYNPVTDSYIQESDYRKSKFTQIIDRLKNEVPPAIDNFLETMDSGKESFGEMSGKSGTLGCNISNYTGYIEGIKINNLSNNVDLMTSSRNKNNSDIQNVKDLANVADTKFRSSQSDMETVTTQTIEDVGYCLDKIIALNEMAKLQSSSSSGGAPATNGPFDAQIQIISDALGEMNTERANMTAYFNNMVEQSNRGRSLANLMQTTQGNINTEVENLASNKDLLAQQFDMTSILSGGVGGMVDSINGMISNFTNLFGVVESQIKQATNSAKASIERASALSNLGIGSINDLSDLKSIGDLSSVAKLGVSCIESGSLDILKSGGSEKIKYVNLDNDDPNKIKALQNSVEQSCTVLTVHKEGIDSSVMTLNKNYTVRNTDARRDQDGHYLLIHKQEAFTRHGDLYDMECFLTFFRLKK